MRSAPYGVVRIEVTKNHDGWRKLVYDELKVVVVPFRSWGQVDRAYGEWVWIGDFGCYGLQIGGDCDGGAWYRFVDKH